MSRNGSSNRPPTPADRQLAGADSGPAALPRQPLQLYRALRNALAFERGEQGDTGMPASLAPALDAQALVHTLSGLQDNPDILHDIREAGSTADYLVNHSGHGSALPGELSESSRYQLDMVDSLFGTLRAQPGISPTLKPILATLQLPLARLALLEPYFLLDPEHSARRFIDQLILLASSVKSHDTGLDTRIAHVVKELTRRDNSDSSIFESALHKVETLLRQQASAHIHTLEQVLRTRQGKEQPETAGHPARPTAGTAERRADSPAGLSRTPRLRRWMRRVEQLKTGSWLSYRDPQGRRQRVQLAWLSADGDRHLFVNEHGHKAAELNRLQLALQLSRGARPPALTDALSIVDRSLYNTLEQVQRKLSFTRNHDTLTRLINRDTFLEQVERTLQHARQHGSQHAVLLLDVDKFNLVNEVYDRISGDQVLLEFSRLIAQLHSKKISSARLAGDEFAVLLIDRDVHQAEHMANRIRADIAAGSVAISGENVSFTVSIGVAPIFDYSPGVDNVMANARSAMLEAKHLGRNRSVTWRHSGTVVTQHRRQQQRSRRALDAALASERFILQAQPIIKTAMGEGLPSSGHYELLLAIKGANGKLGSPQQFISSAERHGSMALVDRWVIKEAFDWISSLMDTQKVVPHLAINLSGSNVTDDGFLDYLFEQISDFGVGTNRLCFEITETGTISNLIKAADFVSAFRNIGCKFSIDNFGTGVASHNYLRELPVDYVKIDGSFITNMHRSRDDYAMARSINDLAHFLGQETIAESVENDAVVQHLRDIGVDYLQGWGVGRPKPLAEVALELASLET